jgi:hypothetical protein
MVIKIRDEQLEISHVVGAFFVFHFVFSGQASNQIMFLSFPPKSQVNSRRLSLGARHFFAYIINFTMLRGGEFM